MFLIWGFCVSVTCLSVIPNETIVHLEKQKCLCAFAEVYVAVFRWTFWMWRCFFFVASCILGWIIFNYFLCIFYFCAVAVCATCSDTSTDRKCCKAVSDQRLHTLCVCVHVCVICLLTIRCCTVPLQSQGNQNFLERKSFLFAAVSNNDVAFLNPRGRSCV